MRIRSGSSGGNSSGNQSGGSRRPGTPRQNGTGNSQPGRADSPNPSASIFQAGQLVLTIGRNTISPRESAIDRLGWSDTLSHIHGKHLVKAGVDLLRDQITFFTAVNFSGSHRFNSLESFGRSLAGSKQRRAKLLDRASDFLVRWRRSGSNLPNEHCRNRARPNNLQHFHSRPWLSSI
jgi:hypothetical protein